MLVKYVLSDGISQEFLPFRFVDVILITDHDLFWNVGQANCILKYFENMMVDLFFYLLCEYHFITPRSKEYICY
jgi:hypothetical protein